MSETTQELPPSSARVAEAARRLGLTIAITVHDRPTRTAEEAAEACGTRVERIVKSLVFEGIESGRPYLLLVAGNNLVDEKKAAATIGEALRRPDAGKVRAVTGYAIGGIPPFGHAEALKTFIDVDLLAHDVVWAAAGTPTSVFPVDPRRLAEVTGATAIAVA